jgi:hypothetical protein
MDVSVLIPGGIMAEKSVYPLRTRLVAYPCFFVLAVWQIIQRRRQRGEGDGA